MKKTVQLFNKINSIKQMKNDININYSTSTYDGKTNYSNSNDNININNVIL